LGVIYTDIHVTTNWDISLIFQEFLKALRPTKDQWKTYVIQLYGLKYVREKL
jgi:hypothetical protein